MLSSDRIALSKTKIVATIGPASRDRLRELIDAGVDAFRLNFAHGDHEWLAGAVADIRRISEELGRTVALLGDLSGPKIRLGELSDGQVTCLDGEEFSFVRGQESGSERELTCTYERLIDDLQSGDRVLLADGTVVMKVIDCDRDRTVCRVENGGIIRSRQGVNLPGVAISTACLTAKDQKDLAWAIEQQLDFIGLSFVRRAQDILTLKDIIDSHHPKFVPQVVAKIEKLEAIEDLEAIVDVADAVMVARGDLGVESDIARLPVVQKQIIEACNRHRIPVITATQMLDSMQWNELPTRAEVSDVANAVLDGTDAVMLSGETAVGEYPIKTVEMMRRIVSEAESLMQPRELCDSEVDDRSRAREITEAVARGAGTIAGRLGTDLIAVATHSGRTALALSMQRRRMPVLALSDRVDVVRRMNLFWGVRPVLTQDVAATPERLLNTVVELCRDQQLVESGSRLVLIASTNWSDEGHDMTLVHEVE